MTRENIERNLHNQRLHLQSLLEGGVNPRSHTIVRMRRHIDDLESQLGITPGNAKRDIARAASLAANFHGREPTEYKRIKVKPMPDALACIGHVSVIQYIAERDGKVYEFKHNFKATSRPHLCVSPDGKTVYMIGGSWSFRADGFEDKP